MKTAADADADAAAERKHRQINVEVNILFSFFISDQRRGDELLSTMDTATHTDTVPSH